MSFLLLLYFFPFYLCLKCVLQTYFSVNVFPPVSPVSAMQTQVENLALRLFYVQNMDEEMHHNVLLMKQLTKRAEAEKVQAEVEKKKQVSSKTVFLKIS